jgi:hypothetical protein
MPSSEYYHRQADICVRMALAASSYEERVRLMEVANDYRDRGLARRSFRSRRPSGNHVMAADKRKRVADIRRTVSRDAVRSGSRRST